MITSIQGTLVAGTPLLAVVELNGLGYEVHIPVTTAEKLPSPGATVKMHTLVIYREDAQTLYGFASAAERDFFRLMVERVSGVGPKVALTIMSKLSLPLLEGAIRAGDSATLAKCPGIGKKTAERLIVELRGYVTGASLAGVSSVPTGTESSPAASSHQDAVLALTALGYKPADADKAVRQALLKLGPQAATEDLVKQALNG